MKILKEIINVIAPFLKKQGFDKKGNNFYKKLHKNYGIINFQKSQDSTNDYLKFTINFGVYSDNLGQTFDFAYDESKLPDVWSCHWQARIGQFMPGSPDHWWSIKASDSLDNINSVVISDVLNIVVPEINEHLSDNGLAECWLKNMYSGTTVLNRFKYLTLLLKTKGDLNTLNTVVESFMREFHGKPNAKLALEHLKEIEYSN